MPAQSLQVVSFLVLCICEPSCHGDPQAPPAVELSAPVTAEVARWIEEGRALLADGRPAEAEPILARAAAEDGDALRTRMWLLRAWMDQGRSDETLAALDGLEAAGSKGPELAYLFGMAYARRAEAAVASGSADATTTRLFADATRFLAEALKSDRPRFADALLPLARAAWYAQELDTARWAADEAVVMRSGEVDSWLARGRVALSQFVLAENEEKGSARADTRWAAATGSFRRALELCGAPNAERAGDVASASAALASALLWRERSAEATEVCANAVAWDPAAVDYFEMQRALGSSRPKVESDAPVGFNAALELGRARFVARAGDADARLATLSWWLGWARFSDADWAGAEESFQACLARDARITNAWFYVGLARAYQKDEQGALVALHSGWDADGATMTSTLAGAGASLRAFEGLIGWCAEQQPARNLEAAFLADMLTRAFPDEPRHWNNLGLFLRDEGERLEVAAHRKHEAPADTAVLADLYERSYDAYQRALALGPDDPQLLNDTALMLQYHLRRDLGEVAAMYRRSIALTEELLAQPDLSADDRARFEQTKSDASGNLALLLVPTETEGATGETRTASAGGAERP